MELNKLLQKWRFVLNTKDIINGYVYVDRIS